MKYVNKAQYPSIILKLLRKNSWDGKSEPNLFVFHIKCVKAPQMETNGYYLISANYGNKGRNLMQDKILYTEVYLLLHKWEPLNSGAYR